MQHFPLKQKTPKKQDKFSFGRFKKKSLIIPIRNKFMF